MLPILPVKRVASHRSAAHRRWRGLATASWQGGPVRATAPFRKRRALESLPRRQGAVRRAVMILLGASIALVGIAGCAGSSPDSLRYPDRFLALTEPFESRSVAPRYSAVSPNESALFDGVPASALGFVNLMRSISTDADWRDKARSVYASELYFNDTLGTASTIDELLEHLQGVADNADSLEVLVQDVVTSNAGTYLRWHMVSRFSVLGSPKESRTIGVSLLRFDDDGRIVFQQDYWDSTEGFYQHIPVLGAALRAIGRRFE